MRRPEQWGEACPYQGAVSYVARCVRAGIAVSVLGVLGWLGGCSDSVGPCCAPPQGLVVSDPTPATPLAEVTGALALASGPGDSVVYVSLPPGTVPTGSRAVVRRVGESATLITPVLNGGFDPVLVAANVGDSIEVLVTDAGGNPVPGGIFGVAVTAARPPIVVRTDPPRKKTDVPINAAIVIVFSEPVDAGTLTPSSVRLFHGTDAVAGTITLVQGTGALAAFVPNAPLSANTEYRLEVTQAVQDLDGDALQTGVTATFTTGQSSTGPAASIVMSPSESIHVRTHTYQLTATVRDAAGNQLIDQPITWSTSCPQEIAVSPTGLVTALADVGCYVSASVNGLTAEVLIRFIAGPPGSVEIVPSSAAIATGDSIGLWATVRDSAGAVIRFPPPVTITSSAPGVATFGDVVLPLYPPQPTPWSVPIGVVGVSPGSATITVTSGSAIGTAAITVGPPVPVASVTVTPALATLVVQATVQLAATLQDATGRVIGRPTTWSTNNATVATVDASGLVAGVGAGSAVVTATSDGVSDSATITVATVTFSSVTAGWVHACGLTTNGAGFCWGGNHEGALGDGSTDSSLFPVAVTGGLTFSTLSAGQDHTCGLTANGTAYCWGFNGQGQLGDGTQTDRTSPVAVLGGLTFSALTTGGPHVFAPGGAHTCGLTANGAAYCWGFNGQGQLGDNTQTDRTSPVAVVGGMTFSALTAGGSHTCGLTTSGATFCWGYNEQGELGDGTQSNRTSPVAVLGGLTFANVSARGLHTCGVTTGGAAHCWGYGGYGGLGDGTTTLAQTSPVAVLGGHAFATVSVGGSYTCGVTTGGAAYCWGWNLYGQVGDGTMTDRTSPVPIAGGLTFTTMSAGYAATCGLTSGGVAYCWGGNWTGQLGNASTIDSSVPVRVAGQP